MISEKEMQRLQNLSKIRLNEIEFFLFTKKLNEVIHMIDALKNLDCKSIPPITSIHPVEKNNFREDIVNMSNSKKDLFSNIDKEKTHNGQEYFIVSKVIPEEE